MYKGLDGNKGQSSSGFMLGSSLSMNALMYMLGAKRDFNEWARMTNVGCVSMTCSHIFRV